MKLSRQRFDKLLNENRLILSLVGMSNIGKTYWSKKLSRSGFWHINCDDLIEAELAPLLKKLGYSGIKDVSRWMGQPYDKRFSVNQKKYLAIEKEIMEKIFVQIKNGKMQNTVIDTTGSIVHTGREVKAMLKRHSLVVYFEASENAQEKMFDTYIKNPKPVIFMNMFEQKENETRITALERSYRKLLVARSRLYAETADLVIPSEIIKKNISADRFIAMVRNSQ